MLQKISVSNKCFWTFFAITEINNILFLYKYIKLEIFYVSLFLIFLIVNVFNIYINIHFNCNNISQYCCFLF